MKVSRLHVVLLLSSLLLLGAILRLLLPLVLPRPYSPNLAVLSRLSTGQHATRCAAFSSLPQHPPASTVPPVLGMLVIGDELAA